MESKEPTRTSRALLDYPTSCALPTHSHDHHLRSLGRKHAFARRRYRWVHCGTHSLVLDGGLAARNELWWWLVAVETPTSLEESIRRFMKNIIISCVVKDTLANSYENVETRWQFWHIYGSVSELLDGTTQTFSDIFCYAVTFVVAGST